MMQSIATPLQMLVHFLMSIMIKLFLEKLRAFFISMKIFKVYLYTSQAHAFCYSLAQFVPVCKPLVAS